MKVVAIFIALALLFGLAVTQEAASPQTVATDDVVVTTQNNDQGASPTSPQQPTTSQQPGQSKQHSNNHNQTIQTQSSQINTNVNSQQQPQVHSIPPVQYHSPPHQSSQPQVSQESHNQPDQHTQHIAEASPGLAMHALTAEQQQQMLRQQQILDQHASGENDMWKFANYTQQQMLQLEEKWKQQAKQAYQNALKQMEERERKEREELQKMIAKEKLTRTQEVSHKQTLQFRDRQNKFNPRVQFQGKTTLYRHHFNDYMFELNQGDFQDFEISLVVAQTIALHSATYSNNDGVYSRTTQIDDEVPPLLQVYEDSRFVVANQSFYFKKFITFEGKANTKYLIRMNNPGKSRLFALSVVQLVDQSQIAHALTSTDLVSHGSRAAKLYEQLKQNIESSHNLGIMAVSNQNRLNTGINHYYMYNIGELTLVIVACLVQVKYIEKLLAQSSIV